jgi:AcrR family transcriptional regulator
LSRDEVIQAAIRIADEVDLAGLSMHAVAKSLGVTTMALYRYIPSKEALIDAIVDSAMGTPPAVEGTDLGWRDKVTQWATAYRSMLCARPWLAEQPFVAAPHGPNWLSWHESLLQALVDTRLSPDDMMDMLSIVNGYVRGSSDTVISLARAQSRGISYEEWAAAVGADLARAINDPRFPILSAILTSDSGGLAKGNSLPAREGRPRTLEESFYFGLERILDAIELYINTKRNGGAVIP